MQEQLEKTATGPSEGRERMLVQLHQAPEILALRVVPVNLGCRGETVSKKPVRQASKIPIRRFGLDRVPRSSATLLH